MATSIHPSQRRLSCELCRKYKSSCRRQDPSDPKCTRCAMLGVECTTGQQKKIGRPRRSAAPGKEAKRNPWNMPLSAGAPDLQPTWIDEMMASSQLPSTLASSSADEPTWSDIQSLDFPPTPKDDAISTIQLESLNRLLQVPDISGPSWEAPKDLVNSAFAASTPPETWLDTPSTGTTAPSPADSYYLIADGLSIPARDSIAASEALAKLSKINMDLHVRLAATEANKDTLDFSKMVYRESPLYIGNLTLAEFTLKTFQELMVILTQLRESRPQPRRASFRNPQTTPPPHAELPRPWPQINYGQGSQSNGDDNHGSSGTTNPMAALEPLLAPLALVITSIFVQLISLCELTVKHIAVGIERHIIEPIRPIPGLAFGGFALGGPCTQGLIFFNVVVHMFERIERLLGIGMVSEGAEAGLLSARQMDVLWGELDRKGSGAHAVGATRPLYLKEAFNKIAQRLRQISLL